MKRSCFKGCFCSKAFTLIELLVVVLIIGILAAVAVPQYRKAVERSKASEALSLLKAFDQAYQAYYLAHGNYATSLDKLDVDLPWTGTTGLLSSSAVDTRSNGDWSLQIEYNLPYVTLNMGRISGKYKGAGFNVVYSGDEDTPKRSISCFERLKGANIIFDSSLTEGSYCQQIMKGSFRRDDTWTRSYTLPY